MAPARVGSGPSLGDDDALASGTFRVPAGERRTLGQIVMAGCFTEERFQVLRALAVDVDDVPPEGEAV
jgi:hypothetical protein